MLMSEYGRNGRTATRPVPYRPLATCNTVTGTVRALPIYGRHPYGRMPYTVRVPALLAYTVGDVRVFVIFLSLAF